MTILKVRGVEDPASKDDIVETGKFLDGVIKGKQVTVRKAVRLDANRAAGDELNIDAEPDDVVEIVLEDDLRLWTSVAQLQEDLGHSAERGRQGEEDVVTIPLALPIGEQSRGLLGDVTIGALRLFNIDPIEGAGRAITNKIESKLDTGLYHCLNATEKGQEERITSPKALQDVPLLIFLHGTASSTEGSFGGLARPEQQHIWNRLVKKYGAQHILAFQHRTLSQSPIENTIELLKLLPEGACIHLVSHSRGGLIGELLCRGRMSGRDEPFDKYDFKQFQDRPDYDGLEELNDLLKERRPNVERFVRVACPARGTLLASKRLDRYLSIILNLLGLVPFLKASPVYDFTSSLLLALAKKRTDPAELPGLEAMMPSSPLIKVLNNTAQPDVKLDADLSAIAGDLVGGGIFGRLKSLATNLFYRENNDLVVNTSSMTGGLERASGGRFFFDKGREVDHFRYFVNSTTAEKLVTGLTRADDSTAGFEPIKQATEFELKTRAPSERGDSLKPVVFLVPGIMGSHLSINGNRRWIDAGELAAGGIDQLTIDIQNIKADALVGAAYADLAEYLGVTHQVEPFPFDWRVSIREEARRFADAVAARVDETEQPVRILAHSMGGLLAQAMIQERSAVWKALTGRGGRLVMLGTPSGGSYIIPRVVLGRERLLKLLALCDFKHDMKEILEIVSRFPGLLELLPTGERVEHDFFNLSTWQTLADASEGDWVLPDEGDLKRARDFRTWLDSASLDPKHVCYVAGRAPATPIGLKIDLRRKISERIQFVATPRGDGRVPWDGGPPDGIKPFYMDAQHGKLADHRPSFPALLELLQTGDTSLLSRDAPVTARGISEYFELPDAEPEIYPDETELEASALGFDPPTGDEKSIERLRVSVAHGNLAFATAPVVVGHFEGDVLAGPEGFLDRELGGRLTERRHLGLYPGPIESFEVLLNQDPYGKPAGAVIIGLGTVGRLTPGDLRESFSKAARRYALMKAEEPAHDRTSVGLVSLLIGTGAGSYLSIEQSMSAILEGTLQANRALEHTASGNQYRITDLQFLELYLDRAVEARHALGRLRNDARFGGHLDITDDIRSVDGGRKRVTFEEQPGWWNRLQIVAYEDGLKYTALTDRARVEESLQATQRNLVDGFVSDAVGRTDQDRDLAATLFELLVPNRLKRLAGDQRNLVLVVDDAAAGYPWELLRDRTLGETEPPIAIQGGLVRQLVTRDFREQVMRSLGSFALVVGDPPSSFAKLPEAQEEARLVARVLRADNYSVTDLIGEGHRPVINALFARPYRIVHLAGHGVYDYMPKTGEEDEENDDGERKQRKQNNITGMVLGDGVFLTAGEVEQLRQLPELVFINCCHLGRIEDTEHPEVWQSRHRLAANISTQLIRMGVKAVVAAGWAVNDDAAKTFAEEFYRNLLIGRPFGEAVLRARQTTYYRHPASNTWGAYQCYGDPDYVLDPAKPTSATSTPAQQPLAADEAIVELQNIVESARTATEDEVKRLKQQIRELAEFADRQWGANAQIQAALGKAYGEVDQFGESVKYYEKVLSAEKALFTVEALEQLANIRSRWAVSEWKAGRLDHTDAERSVHQSIIELIALPVGPDEQGFDQPSSERLSLIGSAYKRLAQITGENEHLEWMAGYYEHANDVARTKTGKVYPYPLFNLIEARTALFYRGAERDLDDIDGLIDQAEEVLKDKDRQSPSFWNATNIADAKLLRHLAAADLGGSKQQQAIVEAYLGAWRRGSPRQFRSIVENIDWLIDVFGQDVAGTKRKRKELHRALIALRRKLDSGRGS